MPRTLSRRNILITSASTAAVVAAATAAMVVPQHGSGTKPVADVVAASPVRAGHHGSKPSKSADTRMRSAHRVHLRAKSHRHARAHAEAAVHKGHLAHLMAEAHAAALAKAHAAHRAHRRTEAHAQTRVRAAAERKAAVGAHAAHRAHRRTEAHAQTRVRAAVRAAGVGGGGSAVVSGSPRQMAAQVIGDPAQFQCFSNIVTRESGWNPMAVNAASGAYGLVQALPGYKMAAAGSDWQTNPLTQIRWGVSYMNSRYGSACGAWDFWQAHSWY